MALELEPSSSIQEELNIFNERIRKISITDPVIEQNFDDESEDDPELTELLRLIECPVCKDTPAPPIYNCCNGHFVCYSCRSRLSSQKCSYCLAKFTRMRNYPLETLLTTPAIQCDFAKYGCPKKLNLIEYDDHVRKCWTKFWAPGKVIQQCKKSPPKSTGKENTDQKALSPCPKCNHDNPLRKVKCQLCDCALRIPTPMYLLPSNYEFNETI